MAVTAIFVIFIEVIVMTSLTVLMEFVIVAVFAVLNSILNYQPLRFFWVFLPHLCKIFQYEKIYENSVILKCLSFNRAFLLINRTGM